GQPDVVLEFPAFTLPAEGAELYRNLVLTLPGQDTLWVESVEIQPGHHGVVHHARLMVDTTSSSRSLDEADDAPGFDGMELVGAASNPEGFFVGWTMGKVAARGRQRLAWPLRPGSDVVLQLHLRPAGRPERIEARVGLHLAKGPPERRPSLVMLGSSSLDIPAGDTAYTVVDEYTIPVGVEVLGVYPHAHYLAKRMMGYATLPNGDRRWLIRIEDWDFNWQDEYAYVEPIRLPAGSVLTMRYTYDNSAANPQNPSKPPRRVGYGAESTDEMADLVVQVIAERESERVALENDLRWVYYVKDTDRQARSVRARGDSLASAGRLNEALDAYRAVLRLSDDPSVMASMALVLIRQQDYVTAVVVAERAASLTARTDPRILDTLAAAYVTAGRASEAESTAREAMDAAEKRGLRALADSLRGRWERLRRNRG
ncbi:MAG: tetratricopeptide repeat protein, partial [Longimicrobiales bacterium]